MSTYASTLSAPYTIRWADRMSEWGDNAGIKVTLHAIHPWAYGESPGTGEFPFKRHYLYFKGEFRYYQAQVRVRRRLVFGGDGGGSYEDWSPWSDSSFRTGDGRGNADASQWNFANVDTKHVNLPYNTFDFGDNQPDYVFATNSGAVYDRVQMEVRIRAFRPAASPAESRHGDWAYQVLETWFAPGIEPYDAMLKADGSVYVRYRPPMWTRNDGTLKLDSLRKASGDATVELMREGGYTPEEKVAGSLSMAARGFTIPVASLAADVDVDDEITFTDATFTTSDGASMKVKQATLKVLGSYVKGLAPHLAFTTSSLRALTVTATRAAGDTFPWTGAECTVKWTATDGSVRTLHADSVTFTSSTATCIFRTPPLDVKLRVDFTAVSEANEGGESSWGKATGWTTVDSESMLTFRVNTLTASVAYNAEWEYDFTPSVEVVEMAGRKRGVARSAAGGENTITVSGDIIRRGDVDANKASATSSAWAEAETMSHWDGILRVPGGNRWKCHLDGVSYAETAESPLARIKATFKEVS